MKKYGYARVSTTEQNLDRQLVALEEEGCVEIFCDKMSGSNKNRPQLNALLEKVQPGDEIVVLELGRFTRSVRDLFYLIDLLAEKQVTLRSLKETWLDTRESNPMSDLLLTIFGSIAQFERALIRDRQKEGIAIAKQKGKYNGRVKKLNEDHAGLNHAIALYLENKYTVKEITEITKISRATLYREVKARGVERQLTSAQ